MDKHASPIEQFIYQDDDVEVEREEIVDHSNHNEMNHDDMDHGDGHQGHHRALDQHRNIDHNHETDHHENDMLHHMHDVAASNAVANKDKGPMSQVAYPVYEGFGDDRRLTGFLTIYVFWADFIAYNLPSAVKNVVMVLTNGCDQVVSYQINSGQYPIYLGEGDHHDTDYSYLEEVMTINAMIRDDTEMGWLQSEIALNQEYCPFEIRVYPSSEMNDSYTSTRPLYYTLLIVGTFAVTCLTIFGYDWLNEKRNKAVLENAKRTNQIVASLFPAVVRDRLFGNDADASKRATQKIRMRKFLEEGESGKHQNYGSKPIADLFTDTTILFADIAGFTAWSSVREPSQVFTLLETLYGKFDSIAR